LKSLTKLPSVDCKALKMSVILTPHLGLVTVDVEVDLRVSAA
jgi:hypothetical protein